jgi:cytochrome c biogenesis protein CcmG/thiol:disulfide interchange protein DsbE
MAKPPSNVKPSAGAARSGSKKGARPADGASAGAARSGSKKGAAPAAAPSGRPAWAIPAMVVAAVAALFLIAVVATQLGGGDDGDGDLAQVQPTTAEGTTLPDLPKEGADPAIGMKAPVVRGASFDGTAVELGASGRPTLVFFVAHWCPHCQKEVPLLAPELGRITPPGVDVVTVSTSTRETSPNYPPSKWLRSESWPTPVLADDAAGTAANAYGLSGFPYFVTIGADGTVVRRGSGEKSVAEVTDLLKEIAPGGG